MILEIAGTQITERSILNIGISKYLLLNHKKMNMKKKFLNTAFVFLLGLSVLSCSEKDKEDPQPDNNQGIYEYQLLMDDTRNQYGYEEGDELGKLTIRSLPEDPDFDYEYKIDLAPDIDHTDEYRFWITGNDGPSDSGTFARFYKDDVVEFKAIKTEDMIIKMEFYDGTNRAIVYPEIKKL